MKVVELLMNMYSYTQVKIITSKANYRCSPLHHDMFMLPSEVLDAEVLFISAPAFNEITIDTVHEE